MPLNNCTLLERLGDDARQIEAYVVEISGANYITYL